MMKKIDIVVAVRNESGNIPGFIDQILKLDIRDVDLSILFVEDGSKDDTVSVLQKKSEELDFIKYYSLRNEFGQYVALFYGIHLSDADAVITMDADGGHPLYVIKQMIQGYLEGYNVVQGQRLVYKSEDTYRAFASNLYKLLFLIFTGINIVQQNSVFRLMDQKACELVKKNYLWGYALKTNFRKSDGITIKYVSYDTPARTYGASNYDFMRLVRLSEKVAYSQLTGGRLLLFSLVVLAIGIAGFLNGSYYILIFSILLTVILALPYFRIRKINPIEKIKILETNGSKTLVG
jgi:dolichol-phosphate mannosyltransferase